MKEKAWFPVVYMFAVTAFFSSIVIGFARFTADRVNANRQLALEKAVLGVFSLDKDKTPLQIHQTFLERITVPQDFSGEAFLLTDNGDITGYAVIIEGKGFWAQIKGFIGIAADKQTITGIAFYEQNETPGLGAEIAQAAFKNQFKQNKKIALTGDPINIKPFGSELKYNQVHAITGATQTCTRLEKLINEDLSKWLDTVLGEQNK